MSEMARSYGQRFRQAVQCPPSAASATTPLPFPTRWRARPPPPFFPTLTLAMGRPGIIHRPGHPGLEPLCHRRKLRHSAGLGRQPFPHRSEPIHPKTLSQRHALPVGRAGENVIHAMNPDSSTPPMDAPPVPAVETIHLTRVYGAITALDDLNLVINRGDLFGFIGSNGAGKTTTLRILATFLAPQRRHRQNSGTRRHPRGRRRAARHRLHARFFRGL
jgi:ABC-type glutathione transport system ATPase component